MARRIRIALSALLVLWAGLNAPATVTANHGSLRVVSYSTYVDSIDALHVVGVVNNDTASRQRFVRVNATFRNAGGSVLDTDFTFTLLDELVPHGSSPFHMIVSPRPSFTSLQLAVTGSAINGNTIAPLVIEPGPAFTDEIGYVHVPGLITNRSSSAVEFAQIVATIYSGATVVETDFTFADPHEIGPNGSAPFELLFREPASGYTRFHLQADARAGSTGYAASWDNYFGDTGATVFRNDIIWLAEEGITGGCGVGRFCPSGTVTREQMASFLARGLELPATNTDFFTDDNSSQHEGDINRVAAAGITGGCDTGRFCPRSPVTREQMASFLSRALDLPPTTTNFFTDDETSQHETNINRLAAANITGGCTSTTFCPRANVTRGQMAAFLHRALD